MTRLLPGEDDTIVALATAAGRGALALIRLAGPDAMSIAGRIASPWPIRGRQATLCHIREPNEPTTIDQCIVVAFPGPRSYTGEDTVEFTTHGGHVVPTAVINALLAAGAREARPGEFTRRAVLNGKLDLVQAEAIGDLIDAASDSMRRLAIHQLDGGLSRRVEDLRHTLLDLEALIAYDIDFPEEDHGPIGREAIAKRAAETEQILRDLLETAPATELVRDGAIVVIAGRPNVGKSSLFNALLGEHRAIVTDVPGTTRDAIEARVQLKSWPVRLVDTAGLRSTDEIVERLGIEVSRRYLSNAHAVVACDDDPSALQRTVESVAALTSAPVISVLTKSDRRPDGTGQDDSSGESRQTVAVSAQTRRGLGDLSRRLDDLISTRYGAIPVDRPAITRARQRIAVEQALAEVVEFQWHWNAGDLPATVAAIHIRAAVGALDELIGAVDTEDVLGRLFATFCIGK